MSMNTKNFETTIKRAIQGEETAIVEIMALYEPLINKYSRWSGKIDEDLKQYIILRILKSLKNFKI